jgi:hypothetical protein
MNAATKLSSSVPVANDTPVAVLSPNTKSNGNVSSTNDKKNGKKFSDILGKAQQQKSDREQTQDTDKTDIKTSTDDTKSQPEVQSTANLLAEQAVLMVNVAPLPNMQILAESNSTDLAQPNEQGITNVKAMSTVDFSKLLQTSTAAASGINLSSLEQLLPKNGEVQLSNQDLMNMLNGKNIRSTLTAAAGQQSQAGSASAGTKTAVSATIQNDQQALFNMLNGKISATSALDQKQALSGLSATANLASNPVVSAKTETIDQQQIVPDISINGTPQNGQLAVEDTQKTAGQAMLNAVTGKTDDSMIPLNTALMEKVSKSTSNTISGKTDKKADVPSTASNADKTTILTKPSLDSINPIHVVAAGQSKQNVPLEISTLEQPVEKISLMVNETSHDKQQAPTNSETKTSPSFGQLFLNSLNTAPTSVGPAANAATTETQQLAKYDIPGQIVDQARLIKTTEDTQMVIKLSPEHLGDLTLKVSVANGGAVTASFHSDNAQVRTILENSLIQLKQELEAKGMKVDNVEVYAGLGDFMSNGQNNQTNSQQQNTHFKNQKIDLADFEEEAGKINPTNGNITEDSVDYRI